MASEVAIRYAEGLFSLARENGTVKEKREQAMNLQDILVSNPELYDFFGAANITSKEKKETLNKMFEGALDKDFLNFIKLLIDKRRIISLKEILKSFVGLANEELGIEQATVYSARPLSAEDLEKIKQSLIEKTGKQISIENKISKDLIAGIKVVVGNNVTDITMRNRIDNLRETLLKKGGLA